ncbi:MAG: hypothetical protein QW063_00255 [Candidatus Nanoarchaeia archaeon]
MAIWQTLLGLELGYADQYLESIKEVADFIKHKQEAFEEKVEDRGTFWLVTEERVGQFFIHFVPKELWPIFRQAQIKEPQEQALLEQNSFLLRQFRRADVRFICYGIPKDKIKL